MQEEIVNGEIDSTFFGREDHGILTCSMWLRMSNGFYTNYGGWSFTGKGKDGKPGYSVKGLQALDLIMQTVGVKKWEDLPGKHIRVILDNRGMVDGIINFMDDSKRFSFREFYSKDDE
ncbi:MAG: hypothetical protein NC218_02220 [Acetobacter sp.]|nr:hypothetical protein [Acetobacter sp.]